MTGTLGRDLARALGSGEVGRLGERYAPRATFEAHLPGGSVVADGRDEVLAALAGRAASPGRVRVLAERRSRGGAALRLASEGGRGIERRRHLLHVRRGRIVHHIVYPERPPLERLPPLPDGVLAGPFGRIRSRRALEPGISGHTVERWQLADGRVLFAKHLRPVESWLMRASGDRGREAEMLVSGDLDRVGAVVDHAIVAAVPEPGGWLLVSEDRAAALARPPRTAATRRALLGAMGEVHGRFRGREVPAAGSLVDRLGVFSPGTAARELEGSDLAPKVIGRGWELFREIAPRDIAEGVGALLERPDPLVRALEALPCTLLHGDLRPANVGLGPGRPVVLDWGLALVGPPAFEAAWWTFNAGWRSAAALDQLFEGAIAAVGRSTGLIGSPPRSTDLCLLTTLVQAGCWFGSEAVQAPDPADRRRAREALAWWSERVRPALDAL